MLLSFVIPVYNVEQYLSACLDSIYQQCVDEEYFEIIAVDDCSPDNSAAILHHYANKHNNFKIIEHSQNKGLGAARNTGLKYLKGKYVWFIDSDDCLSDGALTKIIEELNQIDIELLLFNIQTLSNQGEQGRFYATYPATTKVITGVEYLSSKLVPHWQKPVTAWSRIQKVDFLETNAFTYPEGTYFEDEELHLKELLACQRMKFIEDTCYLYRINDSSIMHTTFTHKKFMDKVKVFLSCLSIITEYMDKYPDMAKNIYTTHLSVLNQLKASYRKMKKEDRAIICSQLKEMNMNILLKFTNKKVKFLLYFNPDLYEKLSWILR